jgi:hypothetical protein
MQPLPLSPSAHRLVSQLENSGHPAKTHGQTYHVASIGSAFYFAYEQLRNVAEYREHHLLLRSAVERYLRRYVHLDKYDPAASDLITELTQSGYLKNDTVTLTVIADIDQEMDQYSSIFRALCQSNPKNGDTFTNWVYQIASVRIETLITPDPRGSVTMQFAYEHYYHTVDRAVAGPQISDQNYRIALFCAVHRALFKSDLATIRYYCVQASLPNLATQPIEHINELNELIDELYQAATTNRIMRLVTRYGAPMRILRELIIEDDSPASVLSDRGATLTRVKAICAQQYSLSRKNLNARIIKSILFILITKTLLGIGIEIPYDLVVAGAISWTPLIINIGFPLLYMATIGLRIHMPSRHNTEIVADYIDRILYVGAGAPVTYRMKSRLSSNSLNGLFRVVYAVGFVGTLALLVWILQRIGFNLVNGFIFFVFFSAVSFLGFRLRQSAHELAMVDERTGIISALVDFLSTPFIRVGHWISDKYSKANIVTLLLDLAIEMPFKTSLRLLRQWVSFLRDKQEEL